MIRRLRHAVGCFLGFHRPLGAYAPTGRTTDPLYEWRVECMWCLRRLQ